MPPAPIRRLRDYTRLRTDLTHDRSRQVQRLEKLLEDALIKLSAVATDITGVSGRAMIEALIAGQRDPKVLAKLARGRMKTKHSALVAALDGRFDDHHGELARMLLDQIDALSTQIDALSTRIDELLAAMPDAQPVDPPPSGRPPRLPIDAVSNAALGAVDRLDEIPGIGPNTAQVILAESGRTAALLRRSPLEPCVPLVAAHGSSKPRGRRGVRCWQPASVSLKLAVAGGVCQVGSIAAQPISLILVGEIVGGNGPADDV